MRRTLALLLSPLLLLLPAVALALDGTVEPERLCARAELVVVGEVTTVEPRWSADPAGGIETRSWVAVERVVRGADPDEESGAEPIGEVELTSPGGAISGLVQEVEGAARLVPDRRYLLLLAEVEPGLHRIVGGAHGAFALRHGAVGDADLAAAVAGLGGCRAR